MVDTKRSCLNLPTEGAKFSPQVGQPPPPIQKDVHFTGKRQNNNYSTMDTPKTLLQPKVPKNDICATVCIFQTTCFSPLSTYFSREQSTHPLQCQVSIPPASPLFCLHLLILIRVRDRPTYGKWDTVFFGVPLSIGPWFRVKTFDSPTPLSFLGFYPPSFWNNSLQYTESVS